MIVSKSRVDRFTSYGESLKVTGVEGHLLHTDTYIKRKFKVELRVEEDEKAEDDGFVLPSTYEAQNVGVRRGHLPEIFDGVLGFAGEDHVYRMATTNLAINKSIDRLKFYPLTSRNSLDVRPSTQAALLPYLCETSAVDNLNMSTSELVSCAGNVDYTVNTPTVMPDEFALYRHRLDEQGFLLIRTLANQTNAQIMNSPRFMELGSSAPADAVATKATGNCLVYITNVATEISTNGVPLSTNPLVANADAGNPAAALQAGFEYVALDPVVHNRTQKR